MSTGVSSASTTNAGTSTGPVESTGEQTSTGTGSTGGAGECAPGTEPATFDTIDGCDAVVGEPYCSEGQAHVEIGTMIEYESNPPHSGPHFPMWEIWGEHASTVERGYWVHNLEHGGVVLSYSCPDGCDPELEILRMVLDSRPDARILLTPDPLLPEPGFAAISWTWVHRFDTPQLEELLCFVDQHFNHAPEDVP